MKAHVFFAAGSALVLGLVGFSPPANALTQTFTSLTGPNGESATATFTTGTNSISLVLTDTQTNIPSIGQLLSDISFSVSGGGAVTSTDPIPTGSLITCSDGGCTSASGSAYPWHLTGSGSYTLTGLGGNTRSLIIGPTSGTYCNPTCPDGIANPINQPYLQPSGTFALVISGVTNTSSISNVAFSFGTGPETIVGVPIPAAVWLFGSGLIGLIGIARRRQAVSRSFAVA